MGACTPAGRDGNGNGKYGLLSLTCAQDHGDTKSIMSCHVPTHRRGGGGGMQAYNGHFQLHTHFWSLDGPTVLSSRLVWVEIVEIVGFKRQNHNWDAKVMSGQPEGYVSDHISSPYCVNGLLMDISNSTHTFGRWMDWLCYCLILFRVMIVEIVIPSVEIVIGMQKLRAVNMKVV